jgi:hypothetical protein
MAAGFPATLTPIVNSGRGYRRYGRNITQVMTTGVSSGGSQFSAYPIIDLSAALFDAPPYPTGMKIFKVQGWVDGTCTNVDLAWDFATDVKFCSFISPNEKNKLSWKQGIKSPTSELWDDCETTWTAASNVTCSDEGTIKRFGTYSQKMAIAAAFTTGAIGWITGESTAATSWGGVSFYVYTDVALEPNALSFAYDDSASLASPLARIPIPFAMAAGKWYFVKLYFPAAVSATIVSHGLWANTDFGAANIYVDNIRFIKRSMKFPSGDSGDLIAATYGDLVITTLGGTTGDELYLDLETEFTYSEDTILS